MIKFIDWLGKRSLETPFSNFFKTILIFIIFIIAVHLILGVVSIPATVLWFVIFYGGDYVYSLVPSVITNNDFFSIPVGIFSGLVVLWCIGLIYSVCSIAKDIYQNKTKYTFRELLDGFLSSNLFFAQIFISLNIIVFSALVLLFLITSIFS